MEFFDVLRERHSIPAYTGQTIEPAILQQIFEAINQAPSAGSLQAYEIYLVRDMECKAALVKIQWQCCRLAILRSPQGSVPEGT